MPPWGSVDVGQVTVSDPDSKLVASLWKTAAFLGSVAGERVAATLHPKEYWADC